MSAITWVPVILIGAFLVFGWLRLLYGASKKNRRIVELEGYAKVYGERLAVHHDSMGSCEEARESWQGRNGAQAARITELEQKLIAVGHAAFRVPEGKS